MQNTVSYLKEFKESKPQIFFVLTLLLGAWACRPNVQAPTLGVDPHTIDTLVTMITYGEDPLATKKYFYNAANELVTYYNAEDTVDLIYTKDSVIKNFKKKPNQWYAAICYYLNPNGKVDSSIRRDNNLNPIHITRYKYDKDGYLNEVTETIPSSKKSYRYTLSYSNGNLIEIITYNADNKPYSKYLYSYFEDNNNFLNIDNIQATDDFLDNEKLGRKNRNMIKNQVNVSIEGDTLAFLRFNYPQSKYANTRVQITEDVLNEFTTECTYHFNF